MKYIDISIEFAKMVIYFLWLFVGIHAILFVLLTIKALALYFFNYQIVIFGILL